MDDSVWAGHFRLSPSKPLSAGYYAPRRNNRAGYRRGLAGSVLDPEGLLGGIGLYATIIGRFGLIIDFHFAGKAGKIHFDEYPL